MKNAESMAEFKKASALKAAEQITSDQVIGLGTGSTAAFVIEELGRRVREEGLKIRCVATSYQSMILARSAGMIAEPVSFHSTLDVSIDGADEIDPRLNLIKGGGGAHTMEKIVHAMSRKFIVVADTSKKVQSLGEKFLIPVELIPGSLALVEKRLKDLGASEVLLRSGGKKDGPVITDNGNILIDARFSSFDPEAMEQSINRIPGVVENGIFSIATLAIDSAYIAGPDGVEVLTRKG